MTHFGVKTGKTAKLKDLYAYKSFSKISKMWKYFNKYKCNLKPSF